MFYDDLSVYPALGGVVFAEEEGERIADYLGPRTRTSSSKTMGFSLRAEPWLKQLRFLSL